MTLSRFAAAAVVAGLMTAIGASAAAQSSGYAIGAQDVLTISVFDEPSLSGKYAVELDGSLAFPLIGRVKAAGLSLRDFESDIRTRLAAGYFRNPQVSVAIEQYRSQRVFVVGEVKAPGTFALTGDMTLIEVLAKAGSTTGGAGDEIMLVRGHGRTSATLPEAGAADDVVHVNLKDLQGGAAAARNLALNDGDTVYVPRAQVVYVFGQVKNPGSYPVQSDTSVLQLLSLAGGVLPTGAMNRLQVIRVVDGAKKEFKVKLTEGVNPGDTIVVPERFF
ncbi:MAG TPA: polysaccharide biosynthesis/export family protein [Vicinamibacterales bacterium]|nr:polysaccharide biosynthesis/export family protein [Vicinamibacterales bacterium]